MILPALFFYLFAGVCVASAVMVIVSRNPVHSVLFLFLWVRATFPRFRYDQLMRLGWKIFLPFSLFYLVLVAGVLLVMGWLPHVA